MCFGTAAFNTDFSVCNFISEGRPSYPLSGDILDNYAKDGRPGAV